MGGQSRQVAALIARLARTSSLAPRASPTTATASSSRASRRWSRATPTAQQDVYEWERAGQAAGCNEARRRLYVASAGGCLSLISTGQEPEPTPNSSTPAPTAPTSSSTPPPACLPQDPGLVDIYDAREGGGFPPPPRTRPPAKGKPARARRRPRRPDPGLLGTSTAPATSGKSPSKQAAAPRARSAARAAMREEEGQEEEDKAKKKANKNGGGPMRSARSDPRSPAALAGAPSRRTGKRGLRPQRPRRHLHRKTARPPPRPAPTPTR